MDVIKFTMSVHFFLVRSGIYAKLTLTNSYGQIVFDSRHLNTMSYGLKLYVQNDSFISLKILASCKKRVYSIWKEKSNINKITFTFKDFFPEIRFIAKTGSSKGFFMKMVRFYPFLRLFRKYCIHFRMAIQQLVREIQGPSILPFNF